MQETDSEGLQPEVTIGFRELETTLQLDCEGSLDQLHQHVDAQDWTWLDDVPREAIVFVRDADVERESFSEADVLEGLSRVEEGDRLRVAVREGEEAS